MSYFSSLGSFFYYTFSDPFALYLEKWLPFVGWESVVCFKACFLSLCCCFYLSELNSWSTSPQQFHLTDWVSCGANSAFDHSSEALILCIHCSCHRSPPLATYGFLLSRNILPDVHNALLWRSKLFLKTSWFMK